MNFLFDKDVRISRQDKYENYYVRTLRNHLSTFVSCQQRPVFYNLKSEYRKSFTSHICKVLSWETDNS